MKRSLRSGSKRIGIKFSTTNQLLNPPAKLFMQMYIETTNIRRKALVLQCKTILINVPEGITIRVQPFDVSINNNQVRELFEQHLDLNLELHVDGKLTAGTRYALITKWVGETWERVKKQKNLIKYLFKKCGLSNNLDGNKDALINTKGYKMPLPKKEFQMIEETDSGDHDDDDDDDDDNDDEFKEFS